MSSCARLCAGVRPLSEVTAYDAATNRFTVCWDDRTVSQLPRIHIVFLAEDPERFALRVATAHQRRLEAELKMACLPPPSRRAGTARFH